jgi:hypothetical protein
MRPGVLFGIGTSETEEYQALLPLARYMDLSKLSQAATDSQTAVVHIKK